MVDLADVCKHLKAMVIHMPEDFVIAEGFKLGLPDDELKAGMVAFRMFLYELYDALASNKGAYDVKTSSKHGTIPARFPIIEDLGAVLFSLGFHGKLETEPRNELHVCGGDMLRVSKMQKYTHLNKMSKKRKLELFDFLSGLGFYFEDADFSTHVDFDNTGVFYVQYENDDAMLTGLKLMASAQANIKAKYDRYTTILMRGDFYPLANAEPKPPVVNIADYVSTQEPEIERWLIALDRLLAKSCKVDGRSQYFMCGAIFEYSSRITKKRVCTINLVVWGCTIIPSVSHLENLDNILGQFTPNMLDIIRRRNNRCGACSEVNNPVFVKCMHGGVPQKMNIAEDFNAQESMLYVKQKKWW